MNRIKIMKRIMLIADAIGIASASLLFMFLGLNLYSFIAIILLVIVNTFGLVFILMETAREKSIQNNTNDKFNKVIFIICLVANLLLIVKILLSIFN